MTQLLWLQHSECVPAVGFHPESLHTKHWEIVVARWVQNNNKWRPAKWEDESFMAMWLSYISMAAHLQSKLKADEPVSGVLLRAGSSAAGTQPCSWGDGRVAPSTFFPLPGLLVLFAWGYSNDLDTFNLSMPLQGRFLLYSVMGKPKSGRSIWEQSSSFLYNITPLFLYSLFC